jgi:DNA-binding SARP family transcriptional activator
MEYRVLGPLEVRAGDGPLPLGGVKQRALLALLLLNANRVVARERLIDTLWGEAPETAIKLVQLYVSQLRKLLPAGAIATRAPGYLLEVDPDAVDLLRFERLVAEARSAQPSRAAQLLREALELWRGPALAEFGEESFFRTESARLEELRLAALEQRIEAELALGRHAELVAELESLIGLWPHRERLRGQLMLALYRSGRQAEALAAYRGAREALDELGLEPSATLRELEQQILNQDEALELRRERPLLTDERVPLPGPLVPTSPFPFVGRADELATLRARLARAEAGEGSLVLLAAEAGGGKTRLISELAHEAAESGVLVLYGTSDAAVTTPYQPLREWLEFLLRACDPDAVRECLGAGAGELARLMPEVTPLTGEPPHERRDPENERYMLHGAVTELLARLGRHRPLLIVADDVHWADVETLQLLRRLARHAPETRWVVVVAFRNEETSDDVAHTIGELGRLEAATRLTLGNLSDADVGEFVRRSTDAEAEEPLVSALGELSDGTPLLLCELWRDLSQRGGVEVTQTAGLTEPLADVPGPQRVSELVRQRLARLELATVALLELAAVAGSQAELRLLTEAAGVEPVTLAAAVEEAVRGGMIEELTEPAFAHRFSHELVRRAVYDRLTAVRRAQLHGQVAEALERIHAAEPGRVLPELAHHFTLAAPVLGPERAIDYNLRAAETATASATFELAADCLARALDLGIADPRERTRVQLELADLLEQTGSPARTLVDEALETAERIGDRALAAYARMAGLSEGRFSWDKLELREETAKEAIAIFAELGDERGLARATRLLAFAHVNRGHLAAATAEMERALVHAEAAGQPLLRIRIIGFLANWLCQGPAPVAIALGRCQELRRSSNGQPLLEAVIDSALFLLSAAAARNDEAREHGRRSRAVLDEFHYHVLAEARRRAAEAEMLLGDAAAAERHLVASWRDSQRAGHITHSAAHAALALALLYCDQGRWDEAEQWLPRGRLDPPAPPGTYVWFAQLDATARLTAHRGDLDEALVLARRATELGDDYDRLNQRGDAWRTLADLLRATDRTAEGDAAVERAIGFYEQKGNVAAVARLRVGRATPVPASTQRPSR